MSAAQLISHLWQSTLVGAVILGLLAFCQGLPAKTRRQMIWVGLLKFAVPTAALAALLHRFASPTLHGLADSPLSFPVRLPPAIFPAVPAAPGLFGVFHRGVPLVLAIWLGVAAFLFCAWLLKGLRLRSSILSQATPIPVESRPLVAAAAAQAGLRRAPRCLETRYEQGPGTLGLFAPVVVLPKALDGQLTAGEFQALLVHEFVHVRRRDNLLGAVQALFLSLLWFNPVVWLLSRRLAVETEKSCDERVLEATGDPGAYASAIFKALRLSLGLPQPSFSEAASMPVVSRVNGILDSPGRPRRPLAAGAAVAAACLAALFASQAGTLVFGRTLDPVAEAQPPAAHPWPANALNLVSISIVADRDGAPDAPAASRAMELSELDRLPEIVAASEARYPAELRGAEAEGQVTVDFVLDATGAVRNVRIVGSTDSRLEASALEALRRWKFRPGEKAGVPVSAHLAVPVKFNPPQAEISRG